MSALAAMTTGSSWRAFALGIRWGCGHSIGLIFMALVFFAAGQTVNLDVVGGYLNYIVGFFMIALGLWTGVHVRKKYQIRLKEGAHSRENEGEDRVDSIRASQNSTRNTPSNLVELMPLPQRIVSNPTSPKNSLQQSPINEYVTGDEASATPSLSFHLRIKEDGDSSQAAAKPKLYFTCCQNINFDNPVTQKV